MAIPKLGQLKRLDSLRDVWDNEATSFTPWLAQEDNVAVLAEAIGIDELLVEAQEKNVGPFNADILCKDATADRYVLIENQLERTDHTHLGQLLTYAAGLGACSIVWVAKTFTSEHRAALDWLNEITDERFHFFGLEIELWQIGDSAIAPKFNVVCQPNDWTRNVKSAAKELEALNLTPRDLLLKEFWGALRDELDKQKCKVKTQAPLPQSWTNAALGRSGINLVAVARVKKQSMSVYVVMSGPNREAFFQQLEAQKVQIETEIGCALDWQRLPDKSESQIKLTCENIDLNNREGWTDYLNWMRITLEKFHAVFSPRVRQLMVAREFILS